MTIPVYFINGFLESGKTEFINYTIEEDYFKIDELTLIIACEDGEVEYDPEALYNGNAVLERLEAETDFTIKNLTALAKNMIPSGLLSNITVCGIQKIFCCPAIGIWRSRLP